MLINLILIASIIFIFWWWLDSVRTKEIARGAGKRACQNASVQFLDDTVVQDKFFFRRNTLGRVQVCRIYEFEFTSEGTIRYKGRITMYGKNVQSLTMDAYRIP